MSLSDKKCIPCQVGAPRLNEDDAKEYLDKLEEGWELVNGSKKIEKDFEFEDFTSALNFVNKVGEIAEEEDHHPDIYLHDYKKVRIELYTHKIGGLHENDFILASKIDEINSRE